MGNANDYRKLKVWVKAHSLALKVYDITDEFPRKYMFDLTSQLRRAALSVPTNIAEGNAALHPKEFVQFLNVSMRSSAEVRYLLDFAFEKSLVEENIHDELVNLCDEIWKMICSLMAAVKERQYIKKTNNSFFILFLAVSAVLAVSTVFAAEIHPNAGKTSASFLKIGLGARAIGMGESYAGIADDVYAVYWNPAGLNNLTSNEFTAMHTEWFQDIRYEYASAALRLDAKSVCAFSLGGLYLAGIERRTVMENPEDGPSLPEGTFGAYDILAVASYSSKLDESWTLGANIKGVYESIDIYGGFTIALDVGAIYKIVPNVNIGMVIQNFGPHLSIRETSYWLPLNIKVGVGFKIPEVNLTGDFDINQPIDNFTKFSAGLEYNYDNLLFPRIGYRYRFNGNELGELSGLTAGIGIRISDYQLDYAFVPFGDLGVTHRISFTARLGGAASEAGKAGAGITENAEKKGNKKGKVLSLSAGSLAGSPPISKAERTAKEENTVGVEKDIVDLVKEPLRFSGFPDNSIIRIYSISGDLVKVLNNVKVWDGKDSSGNTVSAGRYIYEINSKHSGRFTVK